MGVSDEKTGEPLNGSPVFGCIGGTGSQRGPGFVVLLNP